MKEIVKLLIKQKKTISTMESCTGGMIVNAITNISGSSDVLKFSAVTYSNEYKIKMGVDNDIIDKYSVYSIETARNMALNISLFSDSDYGVGITGKLNRKDKNNLFGNDNDVFVSIYDKNQDKYFDIFVKAIKETREENKLNILKIITEKLKLILRENK